MKLWISLNCWCWSIWQIFAYFRCTFNCQISWKFSVPNVWIPFKVPIGVGCQCMFAKLRLSSFVSSQSITSTNEHSAHMFCPRTPTYLTIHSVAYNSYTQFSLIINTCVCLQLFLNGTDEKEKKFSAVPLYGFGQMCILFLSKPPVHEYLTWNLFLIIFTPVFVSREKKLVKDGEEVKSLMVWVERIVRLPRRGKVYKYPVHKVERDSTKFWFCGVQTV